MAISSPSEDHFARKAARRQMTSICGSIALTD